MSENSSRAQRPDVTRTGVLSLAAALLVFAAAAVAEHEADHRYDVQGYVLGADKRPLDGVSVAIHKDDRLIGSSRTDSEGFYAIRLHLHDSDIGDAIAVRAGKHQALVRMQAEHGNQMNARVHRVNFVGSEVSEKNLSGNSVPAWVYLVAAPFVLWAAVYFTGLIRRRVRKLRLANAPAQPGREKKRTGKRRR